MEPLFLLVAFVFGDIVYRIGLPPMVGYLRAGFASQICGQLTAQCNLVEGQSGVDSLGFVGS